MASRLTPVFSVSEVGLKYEALLAASVAVSYSFSGNLMTWLLTQVGSSTAHHDEKRAQPGKYESDDTTHRSSWKRQVTSE